MTSDRGRRYHEYLRSPWWSNRRSRRLATAAHQCEFLPTYNEASKYSHFGDRCCETRHLEVHHLHYETLGDEHDEDLEVLCRKHHLVRHVQAFECRMCFCDSIANCEADAILIVEHAYESVDPAGAMTLDDVLDAHSWAQQSGSGRFCDHCDYMLAKDD